MANPAQAARQVPSWPHKKKLRNGTSRLRAHSSPVALPQPRPGPPRLRAQRRRAPDCVGEVGRARPGGRRPAEAADQDDASHTAAVRHWGRRC
ncbi:unnamed protein product [Miscanthus lutarioriparius]|uniref:Uncharacterized protein n=1 Tax=Miscanthus lutarioriparius TaxID=422564 RepID=A0A811SHG3_9POAL|nr:unnamed protein product [Miscanthus lutarioriparius]